MFNKINKLLNNNLFKNIRYFNLNIMYNKTLYTNNFQIFLKRFNFYNKQYF